MKKNFKIILGFVVVMCLTCCSITVFAEPEIDFGDFTEAVTEPEQTTQEITTAPPTTQEATTQEDNLIPSDYTSSEETEEATTKAPDTTRKPVNTNATTTRRPNNGNTTTTRRPNNNQGTAPKTTKPAVNNETLEQATFAADLPDGHFYVFAEKNNGTDPLKLVLDKPSLIGEPGLPVRKGFIFDGWYADPKFEKRWDFYTDLADEGTIIYAKWIPDPNAVVNSITVEQSEGGFISVNPDSASTGELVRITVKPDKGMRLVSGSLTVNGKRIDVSNFTMPNCEVVVRGSFEVMPEIVEVEEEGSTLIPFIIGGIILLIAIIIVVVIIALRRRDSFSEDEIDENGTIIEDDSDKSWVDESIVVSDGFVGGERFIGNYVPEEDDDIPVDDE